MENLSIKFDESFMEDIESTMEKHRYSTKTEFVREAVRDKIRSLEKEEAITLLKKLQGASKKKITEEQYEKAREEAFKKISKDLK